MRSIDDLLREREREIKERIRWAKWNNTDVRKNDRGGRALDEEEREMAGRRESNCERAPI